MVVKPNLENREVIHVEIDAFLNTAPTELEGQKMLDMSRQMRVVVVNLMQNAQADQTKTQHLRNYLQTGYLIIRVRYQLTKSDGLDELCRGRVR